MHRCPPLSMLPRRLESRDTGGDYRRRSRVWLLHPKRIAYREGLLRRKFATRIRNFNVVLGGSAADNLTGSAGRDLLFGGAGADHLNGGAGDDILFDDTASVTSKDS